jgi:beta-1,4-mannosyl-glycoprotein beta-1,4-N-acetylglucosaminyltransferase
MMLDLRFNVLNEFVHKFVIVESKFSHSGVKKKLNFNINNYPKFKDKIIYLIIENEPEDLILDLKEIQRPEIKRHNSLKRIEQSYNYMSSAIKEADDEDLIILSDNDEIPNLNSLQFKKSNKNFFIFKQLLFYYKFNLFYDVLPWYGSKACKKKELKSLSNLRNLKNKKYPFWRIDTFFSESKKINVEIIESGGWHFTNMKNPEDLFEKMKNFGHHDEFEISQLTLEDLKKNINDKVVFYDHFADKSSKNKWRYNYKLKNIDLNLLPDYIIKNKDHYKEWLDN